MSSEFVLLLGIYAFVIMGAFIGDKGPVATFQDAGPRLGARVERNMAVGYRFKDKSQGGASIIKWLPPK
jgi:hypothetical protein